MSTRSVPDQQLGAAASQSKVEPQPRKARLDKWLVMACALALGAETLWFLTHGEAALTEKDTIVLADFANFTGDTVFDEALRQGLAVQLEQSSFLNLLSDDRIRQTLRLMGKPSDAPLTGELAREVCERSGSAAVLEGSITSLGSRYVLGLRARNCRTGATLDDEQMEAATKEEILEALSLLARGLRRRLGESRSMIETRDTPLAAATTGSLEALKAYTLGLEVLSSDGSAAALPHFLRATEIDPQFAMAFAYLGRVYGDVGESALSAENTSKAYQLKDRVSDPEKFFISASYDTQVTGNAEKAQQTCQLWERTYPRDVAPHALLAGLVDQIFGQYEDAVQESRKAIELDPDFAIAYDILTYSDESLGRVEDAEKTLRRAAQRNLDIPWFLLHRYRIGFLKADAVAMEQVASHADNIGADEVLNQEAFVQAYAGQLKQARQTSLRGVELALRRTSGKQPLCGQPAQPCARGSWAIRPKTKKNAAEALSQSRNREVEYGVAVASALSGDLTSSEIMMKELERHFPEDTSVQLSYLPTLRALLALKRGEPAKALELLEAAAPHELGVPQSSIHGYFGALYPVYVRGIAYLAQRRGGAAAAEFRKIIDHRGIVLADPVGAAAGLQLGRALGMSGDRAGAAAAYRDLFSRWKNADPDIPVLRQARAEYMRLN